MFRNVAGQSVFAQVNDASGGQVKINVSVFFCVDNGGQGSGGGTVTHVGNGCWRYDPIQAETDGSVLAFTFVPDVGVTTTVNLYTTVDVERWDHETVVSASTPGVPLVDTRATTIRVATAQGGGASSITLDLAASAVDNIYTHSAVHITSGTGMDQSGRVITAYNGTTKVATVTPPWTVVPDFTSQYSIVTAGVDVSAVGAGVITESSITTPAQATGRPTGVLGMIRRCFEWRSNKTTRNRSTGEKKVYGTDGTTVLETKTQSSSTVGGATTDQETQGV